MSIILQKYKLHSSIQFIKNIFPTIFRKALKRGKDDHDKAFMELNMNKMIFQPPVTTNKTPYYSTLITDAQENKKAELVNYFETFSGNHLPDDRDWEGTDLQTRLSYFLRWRKQQLCKGTVSYWNSSLIGQR